MARLDPADAGAFQRCDQVAGLVEGETKVDLIAAVTQGAVNQVNQRVIAAHGLGPFEGSP